jgi:hypothetical protein
MSPLPLIDDALFLDNSSLERFTTCPRSAEYYICNKRESSDERIALAFGKAIHKILEARYRHNPNVVTKVPGISTTDTNDIMLAAARDAFADWKNEDPEEFRNFSTAVTFIEKYNTHYPMEGFEILRLPDGSPAIEVPFAVPLGSLTIDGEIPVRLPTGEVTSRHLSTLKIIWTGRIDMIVKRGDAIFLVDHKTTSMMGPQYFKEFDLSSQVYGYIWAASTLLGKPVSGFLVNALAFRKPTPKGKPFEFQRYPVPADIGLVGEWVNDTLHIVSDFVEMAKRGYFPKHTKWCVGKYGPCPYSPICSLPPSPSRELLLNSGNYKAVQWNPLDNTSP